MPFKLNIFNKKPVAQDESYGEVSLALSSEAQGDRIQSSSSHILRIDGNGSAVFHTQNVVDGYMGIETFNSATNNRVGYAILGVRSGDGFLQGQSNTFRIEASGGGLADLRVRRLILDLEGNPASNNIGTGGELRVSSEYIYVCTDTNTWKRVALQSY